MATSQPPSGPKNIVEIHMLADGRVIFGDLPPELAEVADLLRGDAAGPPAPDGAPATPAGAVPPPNAPPPVARKRP